MKKLFFTFATLITVAAFLLTVWLSADIKNKRVELESKKKEVVELKEELRTQKAYDLRLKELKSTLEALKSFRQERLPVLPVLKELVDKSDARTMIKIFEMEKDKVQIKGQGGSAIENMTRWVRIPFVKEGRFVSPVSHNEIVGDRFVAELLVDNVAANKYAEQIATSH